jgi:hypothetical protein
VNTLQADGEAETGPIGAALFERPERLLGLARR